MDEATALATIDARIPDLRATRAIRLGGFDIPAFLVDDELVVQLPTTRAAAARLAAQVAVLAELAPLVTFAVPAHRVLAPARAAHELPIYGHRRLPGPPARALASAAAAALGTRLGEALAMVSRLPVARVLALGIAARRTPLSNLSRCATELANRAVPAEIRERYERQVAALRVPPPYVGPLRLVHAGISQTAIHVGSPLGIAGWDDALLAVPAVDYGGIRFAWGPAALEAALAASDDGSVAPRAELVAKCHALGIASTPGLPVVARVWALDHVDGIARHAGS